MTSLASFKQTLFTSRESELKSAFGGLKEPKQLGAKLGHAFWLSCCLKIGTIQSVIWMTPK